MLRCFISGKVFLCLSCTGCVYVHVYCIVFFGGGGGFYGQIIIALFPDLTPGNEAYVARSRKGASPATVHMWLCMFVISKVSSSWISSKYDNPYCLSIVGRV